MAGCTKRLQDPADAFETTLKLGGMVPSFWTNCCKPGTCLVLCFINDNRVSLHLLIQNGSDSIHEAVQRFQVEINMDEIIQNDEHLREVIGWWSMSSLSEVQVASLSSKYPQIRFHLQINVHHVKRMTSYA
jgi:hypothetical protein